MTGTYFVAFMCLCSARIRYSEYRLSFSSRQNMEFSVCFIILNYLEASMVVREKFQTSPRRRQSPVTCLRRNSIRTQLGVCNKLEFSENYLKKTHGNFGGRVETVVTLARSVGFCVLDAVCASCSIYICIIVQIYTIFPALFAVPEARGTRGRHE